MKRLKQEIYFPIIVGIHFIFWAIDLSLYNGSYKEISSSTMFFGELNDISGKNVHRILGEVFSSWVVTVFAFNFLMATRAKWVERLFGGLDKMYLIHRRSGVIAVVLLLAHFLIVPRAAEFNPGKPIGFYALILILLGVLLSAAPIFKRKIPYHKWINIHKLMGVFYVLGVIHGMMVDSLIKELPITRVYVFGMSFIGIIAWFYRAFLYNLFNKKLPYTVESLVVKGANIVELILKPEKQHLYFLAGQFAFFTFPTLSKREQHPFTISSHPFDKKLRITIKNLGDYTGQIEKRLEVGDTALVEGPFGHFSSSYIKEKEQIWVAGGIGITPFLSLARDIYTNDIQLYWCVNNRDEAVYEKELQNIAEENPNFKFTIWPSDELGRMSLDQMNISHPKDQGYLICGPEGLKKQLTKELKAVGVQRHHIYEEEFAFR